MPFTPFHFGPGAAIHAVAPKHISFLAFGASNVLIDIEPLYFILTHQYPLHRFFHTYIGALLIAAATVALYLGARWFAARFWLPNLLGWRHIGLVPVALGATIGTVSHIVLDSIMHQDIAPLAPFSDANRLLHSVTLDKLHLACAACGLGAVILLGLRRRFRVQNAR